MANQHNKKPSDQKLDQKKSKVMASNKAAEVVKVETKTKRDGQAKKDKTVEEIKASARFIRVAPRKIRLVVNQLQDLEADQALDYLKFIRKQSVKPVAKLINSAVANAENNFSLDRKDLFIKKITADDGPILKRYKPRAHGRSSMIRKRTSHINLILGVKAGATKKAVAKKPEPKPEEVKVVRPEEAKKERQDIPGTKPEDRPKGKSGKGFLRGIFQRKTG